MEWIKAHLQGYVRDAKTREQTPSVQGMLDHVYDIYPHLKPVSEKTYRLVKTENSNTNKAT